MEKKLDLTQTGLTMLSNEEKIHIDGGDYNSGHAAGVYVRKLIDEWGVLEFLSKAVKFL